MNHFQSSSELLAALRSFQQLLNPSPLTKIESDWLKSRQIELWLKRDDLLHPVVSGNKWRKLKYILNDVLAKDCEEIVSMGGCYSNHLHALAFVGKTIGLRTTAYVRGECPAVLNPTLEDLQGWGMSLRFVTRTAYRQLRAYRVCNALPDLPAGGYWLPEGGATALALRGVAEIVTEIDQDFDLLCTPCGTGTTLAGLIAGSPVGRSVWGFAVLKGADFLRDDVALLLANASYAADWRLIGDYHCGGFAKRTAELDAFIDRFASQHGVALDPVYTGKMLFGLFDLIDQGVVPPGQKIVALHTGGLQGARRVARR